MPHHITNEVVIEQILNAPANEQRGIANMLRKLDFANADINDYLKHLAGALVNRMGNPFESVTESLVEQLDTGQAAEAESCASGMKEAGEQLATARESIFKLTTSTLVQCASMAQATGAKGTQKALDKAQQIGAAFLDELKNLGAALDKANEVMKGENSGMGGDNVDAMKAAQEPAVPGAAAPVDPMAAPAAPVVDPVMPAAPVAPVPAVESVEDQAVAHLLGTNVPERIARGAHHRELSEAVRSFCPSLDTRQRARVIDRIRSVVHMPQDANVRVAFSLKDHRLLSDVARFGSVTEALADRTRGRKAALASVAELQGVIRALQGGDSAHQMLAWSLSESVSSCVDRGSL